jgi:opacity protein-like surface antigen
MQKRILLACLFIASYPVVSSAIRPVVTVSAGLARANVYSTKSIMFGSYPNAYNGTNHDDTEWDGGVFVGAEMMLPQNWAWQLGLSYFQNNDFTENGNVYQFADPAYNNLTYRYQIQSRRLALETKLSHACHQIWHPYLTASVGEAFNKATSYTEFPITSADVPMTQSFADHSTSSFTYTVGFGVDVDMTDHVRLGAGYRFMDLGNASLGVSSLQTGNNTLSNSHLYTNEVLAQLSLVG